MGAADSAPRRGAREWMGSSRRWSVGLSVLFALLTLWVGTPLETLERRWFDQALRVREALGLTPKGDPRIEILAIDDADFAKLSSLESEYQALGQCIREASAMGASAVVLDAIYLRGTPGMVQPVLDAIADGASVVFAEALQHALQSDANLSRIRSFPWRADRMLPAGLINIAPDADGTHRGYALLPREGKGREPALALAAWCVAKRMDWGSDVRVSEAGFLQWQELSADGNRVEDKRMEVLGGGARMLNFRGPWLSGAGFSHWSLARLHEEYVKEVPRHGTPLAGKLLFLANAASGVADVGPTSFGGNEPLVLLHATALSDLLQNCSLFRAPRWVDALALMGLPVLGWGLVLCKRKRWIVVFWILGMVGIGAGGLGLLFFGGVLMASVSSMAIWTLGVVLEISRRHSYEESEREHLRSSVGLYFPPRILENVLSNPGRLEPKRVEITVLITDLRNSTPLAELLGAEGMLALLNRVFAVENSAVFAEEGSLEKPVGDQFLAYWGAPDPQADAAERALRAARKLIEGMADLQASLSPQVRDLFGYGLAIHTGQSLLANIGSAQFFHYGVVGDLINATARMESLTKVYGVRALISRETLEKMGTSVESRLLDVVILKGKSVPMELHEVSHCENGAAFSRLKPLYEKGFRIYQEGRFAEALQEFAPLAQEDGPSRLMADRCERFLLHPPREWRGVFKFDSK